MRALIAALPAIVLAATPSWAHALFPATQIVQTLGERAYARFQAVNGRKDVTQFVVEVFDRDTWAPSRIAVPFPERLTILAPDPDTTESSDRTISVLIDLNGKAEQRLRVCTKTLTAQSSLRPRSTRLNTRVCANVTVRRFLP